MKKALIYLVSALFLTGCITNDIPFPIVVPHVTSVTVQDAVDVKIDYEQQEVTVYVSETTDLRRVVIQSVEFDMDIAQPSVKLCGVHDLTSPLKFRIRTYQDYDWRIRAVRPVERYFNVQGQVGSSVVDEYNCRAIAQVSRGTDLRNIEVTAIKLGPREVTTYSPDPYTLRDFRLGAEVKVSAFDETQTWTLFIEETDISVEISKINPWATSAYVTVTAVAGREIAFMYREKGVSEWITADPESITSDGGTFVAHIMNLKPETDYEVMVRSGEEMTPAEEFTTDSAPAIPNGSFEYTSLVTGSNYYKFYDPSCGVEEGETMFWGSGNGEGPDGVNGSANMGIVITTVDKTDKVDGKQSVLAQTSQMVGILAAGNLFTGQFAGLVNTEGGKVNFGRPWTSRPVALRLYCKYSTGPMDIVQGSPAGVTLVKGETYDRAEIKIALGCWEYRKYGGTKDSPVHVDTTDPSTFIDYSTDPSTIAYGGLIINNGGYKLSGESAVPAFTDEWIQYTIPFVYRDLDTRPTHIVVSCAASQYGDYFSGCSSSKLWIDKVELLYE